MIRFRFEKTGRLKYIAHLDLQRTFHRAMTRANIPVAFTQGFNPLIKTAFGPPLSLGVESRAEYADLWLADDTYSPDAFVAAMNETLPTGLRVLEAVRFLEKPQSLNSWVDTADYVITCNQPIPEGFEAAWQALPDMFARKKSKAGMVDRDLKQDIRLMHKGEGENILLLQAGLGAKPTLILKVLQEKGILPDSFQFTNILRTELRHLTENGNLLDPFLSKEGHH